MNNQTLLDISDLSVEITSRSQSSLVVNHVSLTLSESEVLAIVGESGSGKTMTALSIMNLLPQPHASIAGGSINWRGEELVGANDAIFRSLRGSEIGMIFQDPMTSLNPVMKVGAQLIEAVRAHGWVSKREATQRALQALVDVGIPEPKQRMGSYPYELSGGMRQRIMIAMALINHPALLIADEPTTALDVTIQAQILELLAKIQEQYRCAILLITHDLGVVAGFADRVMVMYAGQIVEQGTTDQIFYQTSHPYTNALLGALPRLDTTIDRLIPVKGQPPSIRAIPHGCPFHPRCERAIAPGVCDSSLPLSIETQEGHFSRCHFAGEVAKVDAND